MIYYYTACFTFVPALYGILRDLKLKVSNLSSLFVSMLSSLILSSPERAFIIEGVVMTNSYLVFSSNPSAGDGTVNSFDEKVQTDDGYTTSRGELFS